MLVRNKETGEVFECLGSPNQDQLRIVKDNVVYLEDADKYETTRYQLPLNEWLQWTWKDQKTDEQNSKHYSLNFIKDTTRKCLIPGDDRTEYFFKYIHTLYAKN